jgi:AsmA protein
MKKVLIAVGAVIAVLIVVAIAVPFLVPTDTWKGEIERRASAATGRTLTIAGPVRLSLLPAAAVVANDVTFANAQGGQAPNMVTLDKLEVRVRVLPLLSGNLVIDRFILDKPVIHLEVDRQGRPNWSFATKEQAAAPVAPAPQPPRAQQQSQQGGGAPLSGIQLGDVRISNGLITYADARSGAHYEASDIDASLALQNLDSPFKADGSLVWNKQKISLKGEVAKPSALTSGETTKIGFTIDSKPVRFTFAGNAAGSSPAKLDGTITLDVPSVRELAAWAGTKLDMPGTGLGPLSIKGTLAAQGPRVSFTKATYKLDAIEASGDVAIDASGRVPYAKATLTTNMLDLNPYLPPPAKPGATPASKAPAGQAAPAGQGWSTEPIDASGLKAANADLSLTVEGLKVRDITTGKSVLNVALKDGRLTADLPQLALYGGNGKGRLTVNGAERAPAVSMTMNLSGVQAEPLLKDAMGFERLRGTGDADMTIDTRGGSQKALVSALNGKGSIKFKDGAVKGINLGAMMRNVGSAFLDAQAGKEQETDFAELSGTYTIANGILKNDDLAMQSPLLRVTGKGTVDLPQQTVNYRVEPKVVASAEGQGGRSNAGGVAVPVVVSGPWSHLSYKPDLGGMLQTDPQGALKSLRGLIPGQPSGGSGSGQTPSQGGSQQPEQPKSQNPVDRLKGLLGR